MSSLLEMTIREWVTSDGDTVKIDGDSNQLAFTL